MTQENLLRTKEKKRKDDAKYISYKEVLEFENIHHGGQFFFKSSVEIEKKYIDHIINFAYLHLI